MVYSTTTDIGEKNGIIIHHSTRDEFESCLERDEETVDGDGQMLAF